MKTDKPNTLTETIFNGQPISNYILKRAEAIENYCSTFLHKTGLKVTDVELVEWRKDSGEVVIQIREKLKEVPRYENR